MIDWLLSLVPWWGWLTAAVAAVAVVWRFVGWQGALAALAAIGVALSYGKGRADVLRDERAHADRNNLQAAKDRKEIDDEIDQLGSDDIDQRLARWLRDGKDR